MERWTEEIKYLVEGGCLWSLDRIRKGVLDKEKPVAEDLVIISYINKNIPKLSKLFNIKMHAGATFEDFMQKYERKNPEYKSYDPTSLEYGLGEAIKNKDLQKSQKLLQYESHLAICLIALPWAVEAHEVKILKFLLEKLESEIAQNYVIELIVTEDDADFLKEFDFTEVSTQAVKTAVYNNNWEIVRYLCKNENDPYVLASGTEEALKNKNWEMADFLIDLGVSKQDLIFFLETAIEADDHETIRYLYKRGVDLKDF